MFRLPLLCLLVLGLASAVVRAEPLDLSPELAPGARFSVTMTRERSGRGDDNWILEAKSRIRAALEVLERDRRGYLLRWQIRAIEHDYLPEASRPVVAELGSIAEGLDLRVRLSGRTGVAVIENRKAARDWIRSSTRKRVERIGRLLLDRGYPKASVDQAMARMRKPFLELADAPDRQFDAVYLAELSVLFDLAGQNLQPGVAVTRTVPRPTALVSKRPVEVQVRDVLLELDARQGVAQVERFESLAEVVPPRELLARFPVLRRMLARLDESKQEAALGELPEPSFERRSRFVVPLDTKLPRHVERIETYGLGELRRRILLEIEVRPG